MAGHTAGEWVANGLRIQTVEHGTVLAMVCKYDLYDDTAYADAKLMATAPNLLAFIEKLADIPVIDIEDTASEATLDWIEKEARALIAKAKGESND